ncbi:MAG: hypothetical protein LBI57_03070 [Helicobacteraceae bacterium]|jgi:hypothetical protein|nr:hypothetical protein [Helicobacteraceae bacterium]
MSITPIGGVIYANQGAPAAAQTQQQAQSRADFQALVSGAIAQDERETIEETRPTEASAGINPDQDSQEKEKEEEEKARARKKRAALPEKDAMIPSRLLDIRV